MNTLMFIVMLLDAVFAIIAFAVGDVWWGILFTALSFWIAYDLAWL